MKTLMFDKPGYKNTKECLEVVMDAVSQGLASQVVVASTHGDTGLECARYFSSIDEINRPTLVVVTHNAGFKEFGKTEMTTQTRQEIEELGGKVFTGTMPFRNIGTAIRQTMGYSQQDLVANTLRIFGQGMKVCVEIVLMASDAGLLDERDCIAVAGTARGADTVALLSPAPSNRLFDLKVRQVLAKPREW